MVAGPPRGGRTGSGLQAGSSTHLVRYGATMSGPTRAELEAAAGRSVPDVVRHGLDVLFCGINPGLYSAAVGHHFARPGNRFWKALHVSGFTESVRDAADDGSLPSIGLGITNLVGRATAGASELSGAELREGSLVLSATARRLEPRAVAVLGVGAYRTAFARPRAALGPQQERLGSATLWVLPNPSGLNAHFQLAELGEAFAALREAVRALGSPAMDEATRAALRAIPMFADLGDEALARLSERTTPFEAPAGRVLVEIGQPGAGLFVVESGEVEVELPGGRTMVLGPGSFFGEVALLTDRPRTARVRARNDVRCRALARSDFAQLLQDHPAIAVAMLPVLAERLSDPG